jgi:hypothetical protein
MDCIELPGCGLGHARVFLFPLGLELGMDIYHRQRNSSPADSNLRRHVHIRIFIVWHFSLLPAQALPQLLFLF